MARTPEDWAQVQLPDIASLVLGWRSGRHLRGGRLALHVSMDRVLREQANTTLERIPSLHPRPYEPTAQLDEGEAFLLLADELPAHQQRVPSTDPADDEDPVLPVSELLDITAAPGDLPPLKVDDVRRRPRFLFYAVIFSNGGDGSIAFVKRHNAAQVLKSGAVLGMFGQTVRHVGRPALVFEHDFDLVIDGEEIVALRTEAIPRLFADVEVVASAVPAFVDQLSQMKLPFAPASLQALNDACVTRRRARRLAVLLDSEHIQALTLDQVEEYLKNLHATPGDFIENGEIVVTADTIDDVLDVLAQLHYLGGYDHKLYRADRSSTVRQLGRRGLTAS